MKAFLIRLQSKVGSSLKELFKPDLEKHKERYLKIEKWIHTLSENNLIKDTKSLSNISVILMAHESVHAATARGAKYGLISKESTLGYLSLADKYTKLIEELLERFKHLSDHSDTDKKLLT